LKRPREATLTLTFWAQHSFHGHAVPNV